MPVPTPRPPRPLLLVPALLGALLIYAWTIQGPFSLLVVLAFGVLTGAAGAARRWPTGGDAWRAGAAVGAALAALGVAGAVILSPTPDGYFGPPPLFFAMLFGVIGGVAGGGTGLLVWLISGPPAVALDPSVPDDDAPASRGG